jgi:hypothetical protein
MRSMINDIAEILERKIEERHASLSLPLMMMFNILLLWKDKVEEYPTL